MSSLEWIGASDRWLRLGVATWAGGLVATLMLIITAARIAANRVPKLVAKSVLVAIAVASLAGTAFVVTFPGIEGASLARGAWTFVIAIALGLVAAIKVLRTKT